MARFNLVSHSPIVPTLAPFVHYAPPPFVLGVQKVVEHTKMRSKDLIGKYDIGCVGIQPFYQSKVTYLVDKMSDYEAHIEFSALFAFPPSPEGKK